MITSRHHVFRTPGRRHLPGGWRLACALGLRGTRVRPHRGAPRTREGQDQGLSLRGCSTFPVPICFFPLIQFVCRDGWGPCCPQTLVQAPQIRSTCSDTWAILTTCLQDRGSSGEARRQLMAIMATVPNLCQGRLHIIQSQP